MDKEWWLKHIWKRKAGARGLPDTWRAKELVSEAYDFGFINRRVYQSAIEKIQRVQNGSWMFE
jgi:hypothetical protein